MPAPTKWSELAHRYECVIVPVGGAILDLWVCTRCGAILLGTDAPTIVDCKTLHDRYHDAEDRRSRQRRPIKR